MVDRLGKEIGEGFLEEVGLELEGFLCIEDKEMSHQIRNIGQQSATTGRERGWVPVKSRTPGHQLLEGLRDFSH